MGLRGRRTRPSKILDEDGSRPFRYRRRFRTGGMALERTTGGAAVNDLATVSSFVEELLATSKVGREFAENSLSIKNSTKRSGQSVSTGL